MEARRTVRLTLSWAGATLLLVAGATIAGISPVQADPTESLCSPARVGEADGQAENEAVNLATIEMRQRGESQAAIDSYLEAQYNMTLVSGESSSEDLQLQGQSALTVPKPSVYRDSCTGRYSVFATWQFTNIDGIDDGHPLGCVGTCNVSGEDGFGIALNRSVNSVSGYSLTTCGKTTTFACSTSRMHVEEGGAAGVGYAGLDKMYYGGACCRTDYNFWWGQIVYSIDSPGCGSLQAFSKYGHTWNGTGVNVSVGVPLSVSLSFSSTSNRWQLGSQPSNSVTPC